jgi:plastocyanin
MRKLIPVLLISLAAAGCGGGGGGGNGKANTTTSAETKVTPSQTIQLSADEGGALKFDKDSIDTTAGTVRLVMANPSSVDHNVAVKGNGVDEKGPVVGKDGQSILTVTLQPGEYTFYCSVDAHEAAGMKGTLRVG